MAPHFPGGADKGEGGLKVVILSSKTTSNRCVHPVQILEIADSSRGNEGHESLTGTPRHSSVHADKKDS